MLLHSLLVVPDAQLQAVLCYFACHVQHSLTSRGASAKLAGMCVCAWQGLLRTVPYSPRSRCWVEISCVPT